MYRGADLREMGQDRDCLKLGFSVWNGQRSVHFGWIFDDFLVWNGDEWVASHAKDRPGAFSTPRCREQSPLNAEALVDGKDL